MQLCEENDILYLLNSWEGVQYATQPFGAEDRMQEGIGRLHQYFESIGEPLRFSGIEESFAQELAFYPKAEFEIVERRNDEDYVYLAEKLITLSGRKLHSKKNHLNAFHKTYPQAEYLPITDELITPCKIELNNWYKLRLQDEPDDPFIAWERKAVLEVLNDFRYFDLKGGALRLENRIIAFTYGEQLNKDTAVIHVEKADPNVRGAYPAINQAFVEHEWSRMKYINREEDMGHEGLRKAKESYKPEKMIKKFSAKMK